jgi:hypothetical protein
MHQKLAALAVLALCAGCATVSDVTPIGKDSYMVGVEVRGGQDWTTVKAHAIRRANEYCAGLGRNMVLTHSETSGARGWTPQDAEIQFMCLTNDDPEYRRVRMQKEPDTVIEVKGN